MTPPLPPDPPAYLAPPLASAALEELVQRTRVQQRARRNTLTRLSAAASPPAPVERSTLWDLLAAAFGPNDVGLHLDALWRQACDALGLMAAEPQETEALELRLEHAQRQVLQVAHQLDRLRLDRAAALRAQIELEKHIDQAQSDANLAANALLTQHAQGATSTLLAREDELAAYQSTVARLRPLRRRGAAYLTQVNQVLIALQALHDAGVEVLERLDQHLADASSRAQSRDLARRVGASAEELRQAVQRVNRLASDSAILVSGQLDALADPVDVLAPTDAAALAAQAEVSQFLRQRSVDDAVARARAQVALRKRLEGQLQ